MKLSRAGLDLIKEFEGYHEKQPDGSAKAYRCPAGVVTIGWGCTDGVTEDMVVTAEQATAMLATEMAKHEAAVERLVNVPLSQGQFDALVSFSYNVGAGALENSTLLRLLNAGDYAGARGQFGKWTKAAGVELAGLVRRRAREAEVFGEVATAPRMPQKVEAPAVPEVTTSNSNKFFLAVWMRRIGAALSAAPLGFMSMQNLQMTKQYADTIGNFVKSYTVEGMLVMTFALFCLGAIFETLIKQDVAAGRATPSGAGKGSGT